MHDHAALGHFHLHSIDCQFNHVLLLACGDQR
jgi:hypothetical protein